MMKEEYEYSYSVNFLYTLHVDTHGASESPVYDCVGVSNSKLRLERDLEDIKKKHKVHSYKIEKTEFKRADWIWHPEETEELEQEVMYIQKWPGWRCDMCDMQIMGMQRVSIAIGEHRDSSKPDYDMLGICWECYTNIVKNVIEKHNLADEYEKAIALYHKQFVDYFDEHGETKKGNPKGFYEIRLCC